jgi:hypothetical protein
MIKYARGGCVAYSRGAAHSAVTDHRGILFVLSAGEDETASGEERRCALLTQQDNRCTFAKGLQNHVHTCSDGVKPYPVTFAKKKKLGKENKSPTASHMDRQRREASSSHVPAVTAEWQV